MTISLPPLRYPIHPQKPKKGDRNECSSRVRKRKTFSRSTAASVVREKRETCSGRIRGGVWTVTSKSSKDTRTIGRHPAPLLDILSKISILPQEKWAPQGEKPFHRHCWGSFGLGWERWGEENEVDERSPCRMGFCRQSHSPFAPTSPPTLRFAFGTPGSGSLTTKICLCRLYSKGRVLGHKRAKRNSSPNTSLLQIEGVGSKEEAQFYLGKVRRSPPHSIHKSLFSPCYQRVAYVYKAKKERQGSKVRVIWG